MYAKLFIDDEREPVGLGWAVVRTSGEAIKWLSENGLPHMISFDHDLGGTDTARRVVLWIVDRLLDGTVILPSNFKFVVHSQNPIGRDWIETTMHNIVKQFSYF